MLSSFGQRQQQLLKMLLDNKSGLAIEELAKQLNITRTAVHQHITVLERDGYVEKSSWTKTKGRPGRAYALTDQGIHLFPKHYALLSELLITSIKEQSGSSVLKDTLEALGKKLASSFSERLKNKDQKEQVEEVANIMQELGYQAKAIEDENEALPIIDARNCVYHHLAQKHEEICHLDITLLSNLLNTEVNHQECMLRGGQACRFKFQQAKQNKK